MLITIRMTQQACIMCRTTLIEQRHLVLTSRLKYWLWNTLYNNLLNLILSLKFWILMLNHLHTCNITVTCLCWHAPFSSVKFYSSPLPQLGKQLCIYRVTFPLWITLPFSQMCLCWLVLCIKAMGDFVACFKAGNFKIAVNEKFLNKHPLVSLVQSVVKEQMCVSSHTTH